MNKNETVTIAIDGPSGAGKSTIAKMLSKELGFLYLDTGAMYRAVGLKVYLNGIGCDQVEMVQKLLDQTQIEIKYLDGEQRVFLDGKDVSTAIREHHISKYASDVSKIASVRIKMVELQRKIAAKNNSILDGRDIGTYVLPKATFKFYLTADLDVRAQRRFNELCLAGKEVDFNKIKDDIAMRDYNDMNRDFAPLTKADDAVEIDSSNCSAKEVLEIMISHIKAKKV